MRMTHTHAWLPALCRMLLLGLLGRLLFRVEDGQFEREYSRLYTGIVLGLALIVLVGVGALLVRGVRALTG